MEPKTRQRLSNLRRANRRMPRRHYDIPLEKLTAKHPEFLSKFTSETGKILPRRLTGVTMKIHRQITREVKRARALNLMP